jgi:hypothetical protein
MIMEKMKDKKYERKTRLNMFMRICQQSLIFVLLVILYFQTHIGNEAGDLNDLYTMPDSSSGSMIPSCDLQKAHKVENEQVHASFFSEYLPECLLQFRLNSVSLINGILEEWMSSSGGGGGSDSEPRRRERGVRSIDLVRNMFGDLFGSKDYGTEEDDKPFKQETEKARIFTRQMKRECWNKVNKPIRDLDMGWYESLCCVGSHVIWKKPQSMEGRPSWKCGL